MLIFWFGILGFAITLIEGLEPFLEFSKLTSWIIKNWVHWSRTFWTYIANLINLPMPAWVADLLSAILYAMALVWRGMYLIVSPGAPDNSGKAVHQKDIFDYFGDWGLIICLICSVIVFYLAGKLITLAIFFVLISSGVVVLILSKFDGSAGFAIVFMFAIAVIRAAPVVLIAIVIVLLIDRVAFYSDSIRLTWSWARCQAGIEKDCF